MSDERINGDGLKFRRSVPEDVAVVARLFSAYMSQDAAAQPMSSSPPTIGLIFAETPGTSTTAMISKVIHESSLSTTVVDTHTGDVVGFLAVSMAPSVSGIASDKWENMFHSGLYSLRDPLLQTITPFNSLWIDALYTADVWRRPGPPTGETRCASGAWSDWTGGAGSLQSRKFTEAFGDFVCSAADVAIELLRTCLTTAPWTDHFLVAAVPDVEEKAARMFADIAEVLQDRLAVGPAADGSLAADGHDALTQQSKSACFKPIPRALSTILPADFPYSGSILHAHRSHIIPNLSVRIGLLEDYDDLVPLLLAGEGVLTPLPEEFYLDELLRQQDAFHKVIVAEDSVNHNVVALLCVSAEYSDQQHVVAQYDMEPYSRLRDVLSSRRRDLQKQEEEFMRLGMAAAAPGGVTVETPPADGTGGENGDIGSPNALENTKRMSILVEQYRCNSAQVNLNFHGQRNGHNSCRINFAFVHPEYESCARQLLPYVFSHFPFAEYCYVSAPHHTREPALLYDFFYVPLLKAQPVNSKGERTPLPLGLWLACRHALTAPAAVRVDQDNFNQTLQFLDQRMEGLSQTAAQAIRDDLVILMEDAGQNDGEEGAVSSEIAREGSPKKPNRSVFALMWTYPADDSAMTVGIAVAERLRSADMYALRENYDVERFVPCDDEVTIDYKETDITLPLDETQQRCRCDAHEYLVIKSAFVKPIFRGFVRSFIGDVLRQCNAVAAVHLNDVNLPHYTELLNVMLYASPRRVRELKGNDIGSDDRKSPASSALCARASISDPISHATPYEHLKHVDVDSLHSLYVTTPRALMDVKRNMHLRIVVVGAGVTGLAMIHTLLSIPFLRFSNLFLVTPGGVPPHPNQQETLWEADKMEFLEREYSSLLNGYGYRIVQGTLVDLDKEERYIVTDGGECLPYDYLILTPGRQFIIPNSLQVLQQQMGAAHKSGILALSGSNSIAKVCQHIQAAENNDDDISNIIIYGSSLDAYAVATSIVSNLGYSPQRLVIVAPKGSVENPFVDDLAAHQVENMLYLRGTRVLNGYDVERLEYNDDNQLSLVVVSSPLPVAEGSRGHAGVGLDMGAPKKDSIEMAASLIVCVEEKDVDPDILSALTKRAVVFDGRVIVENSYRTSDKNIFAAGPVAMFSQRYGPSENFESYNSREVGTHLAHIILGYLGFDEYLDRELHDAQLFGDSGVDDSHTKAVIDTTPLELPPELLNQHLSSSSLPLQPPPSTSMGLHPKRSGSLVTANRAQANVYSPVESTTFTLSAAGVRSRSDGKQSIMKPRKLPRYLETICRRVFFPGRMEFFVAHRGRVSAKAAAHTLTYSTYPLQDSVPSRCAAASSSSGHGLASRGAGSSFGGYAGLSGIQSAAAGKKNRSPRYLRIIVGPQGFIECITYFGSQDCVDVHCFKALIGMPESLFDLVLAYKDYESCYLTEKEKQLRFVHEMSRCTASDEKSTVDKHVARELEKCRSDVNKRLNLFWFFEKPQLQVLLSDRFTRFFRELRSRLTEASKGPAARRRHEKRHEPLWKEWGWWWWQPWKPQSPASLSAAPADPEWNPTGTSVGQLAEARAAIKRSVALGRGKLGDAERNRHVGEMTGDDSLIRRLIEAELLRFLHRNRAFYDQVFYLPDMTAYANTTPS